MLQIKRILCPVDFSEFSKKACRYAFSLARHYHAKLLLEHVIEPIYVTSPLYSYAPPETFDKIYEDLTDQAQQQLHQLVSEGAENGIQANAFVGKGLVAGEILSFAERHDADLIVMGTHGRRGLDRVTLGSVTEKVLRSARCPILAIHHATHDFVTEKKDQDPVQLRRILFCTDFSENSRLAQGYALSLASEYGAELVFLHVMENLPSSTDIQAVTSELVAQMEKEVPPKMRDRPGTRFIIRMGRAFQQIVLSALEYQTDMIIMGVAGRNVLDLALFGSTTHRVLQMGNCPILVVPAKAAKIRESIPATKVETNVADRNVALATGAQ